MPLCVTTPVGNYLVVDQIIRLCFVTIRDIDTQEDLLF